MANIKYTLAKFDKGLAFTVIEMDETFRTTGSDRNFFEASNGFMVRSNASPDLNPNKVYLRGRKTEQDNKIAIRLFPNDADRDAYAVKLESALKEWSQNWRNESAGCGCQSADGCVASVRSTTVSL